MGKYIQGFKGMRQDINETNISPEYYYYAKNLTTSTTDDISNIGGIGNIKSDLDLVEININSFGGRTLLQINGGIEVDSDNTILITTYKEIQAIYNYILLINYSNKTVSSIYAPYNAESDDNLEADLGIREKVTILHNKENEAVNKIYWIDGEHQVRSLNLAPILNGEATEISTPIDLLDATTRVDFADMTINSPSEYPSYDGVSTAGMVQYAYSYFNQNGQSTGISPLSEIVPLAKSDGQGGNTGQIVGQVNHIGINPIDGNYDYVQLYRVKYNTATEEPVVSLIQERILDDNSISIGFVDNGTSISDVSLEEFLFLGSDIYMPKAFEIKDDRMFIANFDEDSWDITNEQADCRAYRFKSDSGSNTAAIEDGDGSNDLEFTYIDLTNGFVTVPDAHDCIQNDYGTYNLKGLGGLGASGMNANLTVTESDLNIDHEKPYYKGGEIYRFGIIFVNSFGKRSTPHWMCDYKMPNLNKQYSVEIEFTGNGLSQTLEELDIKGFIGCRIERADSDKFTLTSGLVDTCMFKYYGNQTDTANFDALFVDTEDPSTEHSEGYLERESLLANQTIYPTYLHGNAVEAVRLGSFERNSNINNYSLMTGNGFATLLTGTAKDRGEFVYDNSVDTPINYGVTYSTGDEDTKKSLTFHNTKMWNVFSPEITFNTNDIASMTSKVRLNTVFVATSEYPLDYDLYCEAYDLTVNRLKIEDYTSSFYYTGLEAAFERNLSYGTEENYNFKFNHNYSLTDVTNRPFLYANAVDTNSIYSIYGSALSMSQGQSATAYNNNLDLTISNNLYDFTNDAWNENANASTLGINVQGNKSIFIAPLKTVIDGEESSVRNHKRLEEAVYEFTTFSEALPSLVTVDLVSAATASSIYGGNTYEARSRNSYIALGEYTDINLSNINDLTGTGDTYYRHWSFAKSSEGSLGLSDKTPTIIENMSVPVETYLDLNKRNDLTSNTDGDISSIKFRTFDELHRYNSVYDRNPNAITYTPLSYLENTISSFPNLIRASKQKVPGELVDSFTDILVNEESSLNSKYGPINKLVLFKDNMYVFQENAVAYQSINPRAQIVADDGISVELGTGTLFGDDKYITTESGILYLDRFGVTNGNASLYYFDRMNYSIASATGSQILGLSDVKFVSKLVKSLSDRDSDKMAYSGFDFINNNLFVTVPTDNDENTIIFNELFSEFISTRTIALDLYIQSRNGLMGIDTSIGMVDDVRLYLIERGNIYSNSLGTDTTSTLTTLVKPSEYSSARYDSIEWKSINRVSSDINPNVVSQIQAYNEEQDTGLIPSLPRNKFDMWRLNLPRAGNKKIGNRLNGRWLYIDMHLNASSEANSQFNIYNLGVNYENKV